MKTIIVGWRLTGKGLICLCSLLVINIIIWYPLTTPRPNALVPIKDQTGSCVETFDATQGENLQLKLYNREDGLPPPLYVKVIQTEGSIILATLDPGWKRGQYEYLYVPHSLDFVPVHSGAIAIAIQAEVSGKYAFNVVSNPVSQGVILWLMFWFIFTMVWGVLFFAGFWKQRKQASAVIIFGAILSILLIIQSIGLFIDVLMFP